MRIRRALQSHARQRRNGVEPERHALAVNCLGFVDELCEQLRETSSVLQPLGGFVQQIVRIDVGVGSTIRAGCSR
jgi:hypothetical protein